LIAGVLIWFLIAWYANTSMIRRATGAKPLERKENKRVYNLVENLCITAGMRTPKINIIEDDSLNAFASGINEKPIPSLFHGELSISSMMKSLEA
jgi:heat shock protein HtpX